VLINRSKLRVHFHVSLLRRKKSDNQKKRDDFISPNLMMAYGVSPPTIQASSQPEWMYIYGGERPATGGLNLTWRPSSTSSRESIENVFFSLSLFFTVYTSRRNSRRHTHPFRSREHNSPKTRDFEISSTFIYIYRLPMPGRALFNYTYATLSI